MNNIRVITCLREHVLADALYCDGCLTELSLLPDQKTSILGNIYVGKVKNVVKNIQAAFVEIENGILCYLPLDDVRSPIRIRPARTGQRQRLTEGDELLIQVSREAVKTKAPSATTNLSLTGKYLILTTGNPTVGYSSRLKEQQKEQLKTYMQNLGPLETGLIVRTNAALAAPEELTQEYERLLAQYHFLTEQAIHRAVHSCVLKSRPAYLTSILGTSGESLTEILTDNRALYGQIRDFLKEEIPKDTEKLRLYEDDLLPLKALYSLEKGLSEALGTRVWLKSGAYLVIEPTEALTVIDVNTGKYTRGKNKQETIRKINQEAAREIARQIRLRNLSGMIVIDFVDMDAEEDIKQLMELMQKLLKNDPQKSTVIDMTGLGLMEITRKKQKKTLAEQAKECGI